MPSHRKFALWAVLLCLPAMARAQQAPNMWALCSADPLARLLTPATGAKPQASATRFTADQGLVSALSASLAGSVKVAKGDLRLQAPHVELNRRTNELRASNVDFGSPTLAIHSANARVDLNRGTGQFDQAQYYYSRNNTQGSANQIAVDRNAQRSKLNQVTYSSCARGHEFWQLRARQLDLDQATGRGRAYGVTLAIKHVPLLYLPYLSFPINHQRQSGWLVPRIGLKRDSGLDLTLPYYWNIAPNQDATFYPRILTKRGVMLGGEYRLLTPHSRSQVDAELLPYDKVYGGTRGAFKILSSASPKPGFYSNLLYQYVSDSQYLNDLDNNLDLLSPSYLERHLDLRYTRRNWTALARLQGFQIIDKNLFSPANTPYDRLPQLQFNGDWTGHHGLDYQFYGEFVNFDNPSANRVNGTRIDLQAGLSLPLEWPAGFIQPSVKYRYTAYNLRGAAPGASQNPQRAAPIVSVDSGVFFDRPVDWSWLGGAGTQTLEPRLYYLYVPYRNQNAIPLFDTTAIDRSYSWLFMNNRFTGADRLGDANQLTAALTTRITNNATGRERFYAAIGDILYFNNRRVTLAGGPPQTSFTSGPIAEARIGLNHGFSLRGSLQWDPQLASTSRSALDLTYQPDDQHLVSLTHSFSKGTLNQLDLSFIWPINDRWSVLGRWNYSLAYQQNVDTFAGFEYDDCCWAIRMVARRHRLTAQDNQSSDSVYLEVELKGLANVGRHINDLLRNTILGYNNLQYR